MAKTTMLVYLLLSVVFCEIFIFATAKPARCTSEEDCMEGYMHPDMPVSPKLRKTFDESTSEYWLENGFEFVQRKMITAEQPQRGVAKNIIFFLGDGMSLATIAATRIYLGGEEVSLSFENFPDAGLSKTYAIDRLIPDSACTATALLCGVKSRYGTIGVNGHVTRGDCSPTTDDSNHVDSIAKWALDEGKSVGLVTNVRITDATPAGLYAHTSESEWENDKKVKDDCGKKSGVDDIALQLITGDVGKQLKVVLGGGKAQFIDKDLYDDGKRRDGRNLIKEFLKEQGNVFVESESELDNVNPDKVNRVLGLFDDDNMPYHMKQKKNIPTLSEMTEKAIEILSRNDKGFFLFVENGKIDNAHHKTMAQLAVDETAELSEAVAVARELTNQEDTLIVVTADHSHTMSLAGYAPRSNDVFGIASLAADDNVPYMTLTYANGPSFNDFFDTKTNTRVNPENLIDHSYDDVFPATVPLKKETHGGEDVPVYASGPWSHLFSGAYEQSTIPHLIAYAGCLGDGQKACD